MVKTKKKTKTAEEVRQQKRDCERKRRMRIKNNPALYEAAKEKDRARYAEKKQKQQVKLVADMTPRQHRNQRKEWRQRKERSRLKQKRNKILLAHLRDNSPNTTDDEEAVDIRPQSPSVLIDVSKEVAALPQSDCVSDSQSCSISLRSTPLLLPESSPSYSQCSTSSRQKIIGLQKSKAKREFSNMIIKKQNKQIQALKQKIHTNY